MDFNDYQQKSRATEHTVNEVDKGDRGNDTHKFLNSNPPENIDPFPPVRNEREYTANTREGFRKWHAKLRRECIQAYGHTCECCGETTYEFLTIDHIEGGGRRERNQHGGGSNLLRALRKKGFPPGYRVLCYNCNNSYGMYGYCPHKAIKSTEQDNQ